VSAAPEARVRLHLGLSCFALAALWAIATNHGPFSDTSVNDLFVYRNYAIVLQDGQLPYLDFGFEYPPLAALPIWLGGLRGVDEPTYTTVFYLVMLGCGLVGQQLVARLAGGGRETIVVAWLMVLTPVLMGASLRTHFDLMPIAIATGALLAFARDRPWIGFALLGVGTMTKLFPGLLAVLAFALLFSRGERRTALIGGAIFTAVVVAISLPFLSSGYVDSYRFHLDRPVQIESTAASVLFALGGSDVTGTNLRPDRFKSNGLDGGHATAVMRLFTLTLAFVLAFIVALAARRRDARHFVLCCFAALLAFVTLGKVFSPQFVIWLAPFAALAWAWRQWAVAALTTVAIALTQVEFPSRYVELVQQQPDVIKLVAVRNVLLIVALVVLVTTLARAPRDRLAATVAASAA
jgi:uncharacterized membrane protein